AVAGGIRSGCPSNPSAAAITAGREVLSRIEDYLGRGVSFAVETTLSSPRNIDLIRRAKSLGYETHLIFVALDSPDRSILRIRNRASRGGRFVPDADVKRRYARSIANVAKAIRLTGIADVYDNSEGEARLVVLVRAGRCRSLARGAFTKVDRLVNSHPGGPGVSSCPDFARIAQDLGAVGCACDFFRDLDAMTHPGQRLPNRRIEIARQLY